MLSLLAAVALSSPLQADPLDDALAILESLQSVTPAARYEDAPLGAVIADLADRAPVGCWADWKSLERLLIHRDDELSLTMPEGPLATLFAAVALHLGDEFERPVFEVYEGQIVLSTLEATASMAMTSVYDVRDLTADDTVIADLGGAGPDEMVEPAEARDEAGSAPDTAEPAPPPPPPPPTGSGPQGLRSIGDIGALTRSVVPDRPRTPAERLWHLIAQHVDPDAWRDLGGSRGLVDDHDGLLLVTAPATTHRRFRAALDRLRRARPTALEVEAAIVDCPQAELDRYSRRLPLGSARLARSLLGSDEVAVRWHTRGVVAIGEAWSASGADGQVDLDSRQDAETGAITVHLEAISTLDGDERRVTTTIAVPLRDGGAVIEMPGDGEMLRLVVVIPVRR